MDRQPLRGGSSVKAGALCRLAILELGEFENVPENRGVQHRSGMGTTLQPGSLTCHFGGRLVPGENGPGERVVMKNHPSQ